MTTRRRKRKLKAEINVVPYIDVMLVLLIIFMVTAPLLNLGTDVQLPDSEAKSLKTPKDPFIVVIKQDGRIALRQPGESESTFMDDAELGARLAAIKAEDRDVTVLVAGDRNATYQDVTRGLSLVSKAGITKVSLMSQPVESAR